VICVFLFVVVFFLGSICLFAYIVM
jgi:hypothetical protein